MLVIPKTLAFILSAMGIHLRVWNRKVTTCIFNSGCCAERRGKEGKGKHRKTEYKVTAIFRTRYKCLGPREVAGSWSIVEADPPGFADIRDTGHERDKSKMTRKCFT